MFSIGRILTVCSGAHKSRYLVVQVDQVLCVGLDLQVPNTCLLLLLTIGTPLVALVTSVLLIDLGCLLTQA